MAQKYEALKLANSGKDSLIEELKTKCVQIQKQFEERGDHISYKDKEIKELREALTVRILSEDFQQIQLKLKEAQEQLMVERMRSTNLQTTINDLLSSNNQYLSTISKLKLQYESRVHSPQRTEPINGSHIHKNEEEVHKLKISELLTENEHLKNLNAK